MDNKIDISQISTQDFVRLKLAQIEKLKADLKKEEEILSQLLKFESVAPISQPSLFTKEENDQEPTGQYLTDRVINAIKGSNGGLTNHELSTMVDTGETEPEEQLKKIRWVTSRLIGHKRIAATNERPKRYYIRKPRE